jgi:hypothetical protein
MNAAVTINGKPLSEYLCSEIPQALAKEAESELTEKEEQAADAATD